MPSDAHAPEVDLTGAAKPTGAADASRSKAAAPELKSIRWNEERDVALLTQISSAGVKSFVTNKANDNVSAKKKAAPGRQPAEQVSSVPVHPYTCGGLARRGF